MLANSMRTFKIISISSNVGTAINNFYLISFISKASGHCCASKTRTNH